MPPLSAVFLTPAVQPKPVSEPVEPGVKTAPKPASASGLKFPAQSQSRGATEGGAVTTKVSAKPE